MLKEVELKSNSESRCNCDGPGLVFWKGKKAGYNCITITCWPCIFLQSWIEPGQASLFSGIRLHRFEVMEILKLNLSENIFIRRRSAPFPPALKAKGCFEE